MMQRKIIIDTSVYIDIFNHNLHSEIVNPFQNVTYLAYPVLHELWMGLKNKQEIRALTQWRERFIRLKRFVIPTVATLTLIGDACLQLRVSGKLDPVYPKHYNDICISALAHQIGAAVLTKNSKDFKVIRDKVDFEFESVN
jgi:predicted nucleic acid-binding protein